MLIKPITFDEKDVTQINTAPVSSSEIKPYDIELHEKMANNKINLINYIDNTKTNKSCYVINISCMTRFSYKLLLDTSCMRNGKSTFDFSTCWISNLRFLR